MTSYLQGTKPASDDFEKQNSHLAHATEPGSQRCPSYIQLGLHALNKYEAKATSPP